MTASTSWISSTRRKSRSVFARPPARSFEARSALGSYTSQVAASSVLGACSRPRMTCRPRPPHPISPTTTRSFAPRTLDAERAVHAVAARKSRRSINKGLLRYPRLEGGQSCPQPAFSRLLAALQFSTTSVGLSTVRRVSRPAPPPNDRADVDVGRRTGVPPHPAALLGLPLFGLLAPGRALFRR